MNKVMKLAQALGILQDANYEQSAGYIQAQSEGSQRKKRGTKHNGGAKPSKQFKRNKRLGY